MAAKKKARKTAKKGVTRKTAKKRVTRKKTARAAPARTAIGGAFDILAGKKPDPDGPWKPGEGWAQSSTGWGQWLKARKPKKQFR